MLFSNISKVWLWEEPNWKWPADSLHKRWHANRVGGDFTPEVPCEKPYFRCSEPLQVHFLSEGFPRRTYSSLSGFTGEEEWILGTATETIVAGIKYVHVLCGRKTYFWGFWKVPARMISTVFSDGLCALLPRCCWTDYSCAGELFWMSVDNQMLHQSWSPGVCVLLSMCMHTSVQAVPRWNTDTLVKRSEDALIGTQFGKPLFPAFTGVFWQGYVLKRRQ